MDAISVLDYTEKLKINREIHAIVLDLDFVLVLELVLPFLGPFASRAPDPVPGRVLEFPVVKVWHYLSWIIFKF